MGKREYSRLAELAVEVAICAPLRRNKYAHAAATPWGIVEDIRKQMEDSGVNWRELVKDRLAREETRKAARVREKYGDG